MITLAVNNPLDKAKAEAEAMALTDGQQWTVVLGYDECDRLTWIAIPLRQATPFDERVYLTVGAA